MNLLTFFVPFIPETAENCLFTAGTIFSKCIVSHSNETPCNVVTPCAELENTVSPFLKLVEQLFNFTEYKKVVKNE